MENSEDAFSAAGTNLPLLRLPWHGMTFVLSAKSEVHIDERGSKQLHYTPLLLLWVRWLQFDQRERN